MILRRCLILQNSPGVAHIIMLSPKGKNVLRRKTAYRPRKSERFHGQD